MNDSIDNAKITISTNAGSLQKLLVSWYNVKIAFVCRFYKKDKRLTAISRLTFECYKATK